MVSQADYLISSLHVRRGMPAAVHTVAGVYREPSLAGPSEPQQRKWLPSALGQHDGTVQPHTALRRPCSPRPVGTGTVKHPCQVDRPALLGRSLREDGAWPSA
jgi:hypothetical protein